MNKKAFTLIELLVVIAIIAILAAILFPVFAQAKLAAKETSALSNTKQMGLATLMYVNDYDDTFPLAGVLRPGGGKLGMGVTAPYPYNDGLVLTAAAAGANPTTIWDSVPRQNMAECYAPNSVQPYIKSLPLESLTGLSNVQTGSDASFGGAGFVAPGDANLSFNGDLHHYSTTAVVESSITPMWWPGQGSINIIGHSASEPALNCANTVDDCMFNSGSSPEAGGASHLLYSSQPGDILFLQSTANATPYPYSNMRGPIVRCDGSAKSYNMNAPMYPSYLTGGGAWLEPYVEYMNPAQATAKYGIDGWVGFNDVCSTGDTLWNGSGSVNDTYSCFFRPDRTK
jgi:prepilin-type N-terminal cleavage/methylation domain-containing protein